MSTSNEHLTKIEAELRKGESKATDANMRRWLLRLWYLVGFLSFLLAIPTWPEGVATYAGLLGELGEALKPAISAVDVEPGEVVLAICVGWLFSTAAGLGYKLRELTKAFSESQKRLLDLVEIVKLSAARDLRCCQMV